MRRTSITPNNNILNFLTESHDKTLSEKKIWFEFKAKKVFNRRNRRKYEVVQGYDDQIITIDSHTCGEPTRLILGYEDKIYGSDMKEKREYFIENFDHIRLLLTREPRGNKDTIAAVVTQTNTPNAKFGLIYMDAEKYPYLCGHATIGAVVTAIKLGFVKTVEGENIINIDTPSGITEAEAFIKKDKIDFVSIRLPASFVLKDNHLLDVEGFGNIKVSFVCVGGFFAMAASDDIKIDIIPENKNRLIHLGMAIMKAANKSVKVYHPTRKEVKTIDAVEFYDYIAPGKTEGKSIVIYGDAHIDRSPCGTGTAAKLTLMYKRGFIDINRRFINFGPLGTSFTGYITEETDISGNMKGVTTKVEGTAYLTGIHKFLLDPPDPFPKGFTI